MAAVSTTGSAFADRTGLLGSSSSGNVNDGYNSGYCGLVLAGTADGHVCCLDVETGTLVEDFTACWEPRQQRQLLPAAAAAAAGMGYYSQQQHHPLLQQQPTTPLLLAGSAGTLGGWENPSSCVVSAVCSSSSSRGSGGWLAAGSGSGRLLLLDARAGLVIGSWKAHSHRVSQLQGLEGTRGDWQLLSCSQDKMLKLWDLRMLRHTRHWSGGNSSSSGSLPVAAFKGTKDGIEGFVVYQDAAIVYGGANLGLAPLDSSGSSSSNVPSQQQQGWSAPAAAVTRNVRMTGVRGGSTRGLGSSAKVSREGLGPKVASSGSAIIGLGLLQHSKLLVVGCEDGQLKICR
jgi:WD40 repeat protein